MRLTELQAAEPLRPVRDRLTKVLREHPPAEQKNISAKGVLEQAGVDATEAKIALTSAQSIHDQAEEDFRSFAPIWNEAARIALDNIVTELDILAEQIQLTESAQQNATAELDVRAHLFPLADQLSNVEALCVRYESSSIEAVRQQQQQAETKQNAASLRETLTALDVEVEVETRSLQQTANTAQTLHQELEDSQEDKWQTEEAELTSLHRNARDAEHIAERFQIAASLHNRAQAEYQAATTSVFEATARAQSSETALREQTKQREEKQHSVALAEQSLDERNARLRSLLVDGESCPICGATEHPYAAPGADDALTILAENLRKERSALDAAISRSNRELQKATTERTAAEGQVRNTERNSAQGTGDMQKAADEFRVLRATMEPACIQFGLIALLPPELTTDAQAASVALELLADVEARRLVSSEQLSALKNLRRQLDDANKSQRDAQAALQLLTRSRDKTREALHALELQVASASEGAKQSTGWLKEIETALSPFLLVADISPERLPDNARTVLARFRDLASEVAELRTRITDLSVQANQLAWKQTERTAFRQHFADQAKETIEAVESREEHYRRLSDARAVLLAGEDTSQHRTRINADRLNAQTALQAAQTTYSAADSNLARTSEQERSASMAFAALLAELAEAREAYNDGCSSLNIESIHADKLLYTSSSETIALKTRLDALDHAIRDAENTVTERQSVLDSLPVIGEDPADRAELATILDNLTTSLNLSREQIGIQKGRIEHDDALRLTAADLRHQADEKDDELAIWQQVEVAIGSANGDRFRTFAQSLTLEHLVQLANEHLANFSRRYQLAPDSDLSLHVIDNDMGEEHRPIRSLSGGERFLVSLSLALSLAGLEGHDFSVDTLFIDEGFGALDAETLDIAITALETLHGRGRKVGVITHVAAMIESIPVQVKVEKLGGGSSMIRLESAVLYA